MTNKLYIDLRRSHELNTIRLDSSKVNILNIPAENIKFNLKQLENIIKSYDKVYLVCGSGSRASLIKEKYFDENDKVKKYSYNFGNIEDSKLGKYTIKGEKKDFGLTRTVQMVSALIVLLILGLTYINPDLKLLYLGFGLFMFYVGYSGNCIMSKFLIKY